jgi:hypothetical protein
MCPLSVWHLLIRDGGLPATALRNSADGVGFNDLGFKNARTKQRASARLPQTII